MTMWARIGDRTGPKTGDNPGRDRAEMGASIGREWAAKMGGERRCWRDSGGCRGRNYRL